MYLFHSGLRPRVSERRPSYFHIMNPRLVQIVSRSLVLPVLKNLKNLRFRAPIARFIV